MNESPTQYSGERKAPILAQPGSVEKRDYEYEYKGVCNNLNSYPKLKFEKMSTIPFENEYSFLSK